jgi:hypothetical protein
MLLREVVREPLALTAGFSGGKAPKGRDIPAQGNALGKHTPDEKRAL